MTLCGLVLVAGLKGALAGGADLRACSPSAARIYGSLGCATPERDPGLSRLAHPALGAGRGAVGAVQQLQPGHDRRPGAGAVVRAAVRRAARAVVRLCRDRGRGVRRDPAVGCPTTTSRGTAGGAGHGAAMSYPSLGSSPTGASVIAATSPQGAAAEMERPAHPRRGSSPGWSPAMPRRRRWPASAFSSSTGCGLAPHGSEAVDRDRDDGRGRGDAGRAMGADPAARPGPARADPVGLR